MVECKAKLVGLGCEDPDVIKHGTDAVVFLLTFNSLCGLLPTDSSIVLKAGCAFLPMWLRLIYQELAIFKKMRWNTFLSMAMSALISGQLHPHVVEDEVEAMLRARRGRPGAPLVIIVDELAQCKDSLPAGLYGRGYDSADDAYRSVLCRLVDICGGIVGTTSVSQQFIVNELRASPRDLLPAAVLRPLDRDVSSFILRDGMQALHARGLEFNSVGEVVRAGAGYGLNTPQFKLLLESLVSVCGGHPRLVCNLSDYIGMSTLSPKSSVKTLLTKAGSSLLQDKKTIPSLGRSADFTEAVLLDVLLHKSRRYFDAVACRRLQRNGEVHVNLVPREDKLSAALFYDYDEVSTSSPVGLTSDPSGVLNQSATLFVPPPALFGLKKGRRVLPTLQALVNDILTGHPALRWSVFESFYVSYERALSLARCLHAEDYGATTLKKMYQTRAQSCYVGCSVLLTDVLLDASLFREEVVSDIDLDQVLRLAGDPARRREVLHTLYVLRDGACGVDAIMFYDCVQDCSQYKKGDLIAVAVQLKYSVDAAKTKLGPVAVGVAWGKAIKAFKDSWPSWRDRVVFLVAARRTGGVSSADASITVAQVDADRATDAEGGTDEHEEGGSAGGLTDTGGVVHDHDEGERASELSVEDWSPQAIVLNRSDLMDLLGPSLGGLMGASDYWFTASPYTAFSSVFVGGSTG